MVRIPARKNCVRTLGLVALIFWAGAMTACQLVLLGVDAEPSGRVQTAGQGETAPGLVIENDTDLPDTYPHANYQLRFQVRGRGGGLHWKLEKGAIPPGMRG